MGPPRAKGRRLPWSWNWYSSKHKESNTKRAAHLGLPALKLADILLGSQGFDLLPLDVGERLPRPVHPPRCLLKPIQEGPVLLSPQELLHPVADHARQHVAAREGCCSSLRLPLPALQRGRRRGRRGGEEGMDTTRGTEGGEFGRQREQGLGLVETLGGNGEDCRERKRRKAGVAIGAAPPEALEEGAALLD